MAAAVPEIGSYLDAVHGFLQEMKEFSDLPRLQAQEFENIRSRLQQSEYTFQAASTVAAKVRALQLTTAQKDNLLSVFGIEDRFRCCPGCNRSAWASWHAGLHRNVPLPRAGSVGRD